MEYVAELDKGIVLRLKLLLVGVLGEVKRKRPVRTEKPEETNEHFSGLTPFARAKRFDCGRCKR